MNKIITANINGFIFPIDELAYEKLKSYLLALRNKIKDQETITDIENRIAELFNIQIQQGKLAILEDDLNAVIAQIGEISEIEDHENEQTSSFNSTFTATITKSFFRDKDNKQLFGVCSGIAAYLNIDVRIIRILFVLFIWFGIGIPVYFLIVLFTPYANSESQKSQMHGNPDNYNSLNNFKSNAKDTFDTLKTEVKNNQNTKTIKLLATFFLVALISVVVPSIFGLIFSAGVISLFLESIQRFILVDIQNIALPFCATLLIIVIPVVMIFYRLIRIVFEGQKMPKALKIVLNSIWVLSIIYMFYFAINLGHNFDSSYSISHTEHQKTPSKDSTINIRSSEFSIIKNNQEFIVEDPDLMDFMNNKFSENVSLKIFKTTENKPYVKINRYSRGSRENAMNNATGINYKYSFDSNQLVLSNYFTLEENIPWRIQRITVSVFVPEGFTINIDKSCKPIIYEVENQDLGLDQDDTESAKLKSTSTGIIYIHQ